MEKSLEDMLLETDALKISQLWSCLLYVPGHP